MERSDTCPACGQPDALIALGVRPDHPHRWRPWVTVLTELYLCDRCEALVEAPGRIRPDLQPWRVLRAVA